MKFGIFFPEPMPSLHVVVVSKSSHLKNPQKGSRSVIEYLQWVKGHVDELAPLGAPMDAEDLIGKKF